MMPHRTTKPRSTYAMPAPELWAWRAKPAATATAITTRKGTNWPMLYITAGWPLKRSFSDSASLVAANAERSVLQKRHLSATALMVSPQTGQGLVSSSMIAPPASVVGRAILPAAGFQPAGPAGKRVRSLKGCPTVHTTLVNDIHRWPAGGKPADCHLRESDRPSPAVVCCRGPSAREIS